MFSSVSQEDMLHALENMLQRNKLFKKLLLSLKHKTMKFYDSEFEVGRIIKTSKDKIQ